MKLKSMPLTAGTILRNLAVGAWFWVCIWWAVSETSTAKLRQESQHCVLAECPQWGQVVGVWGSHYPPPRGKGCPPVLLSRSLAEWWAPPPLIQVGTHLWPRMAAKGLVGTHVNRHTAYTMRLYDQCHTHVHRHTPYTMRLYDQCHTHVHRHTPYTMRLYDQCRTHYHRHAPYQQLSTTLW